MTTTDLQADALPNDGPLADLLRALAPPLDFLAADDFRHCDRTHLPLASLQARVDAARPVVAAGVRGVLDELAAVLTALDERSAGDRVGALRRAHGLLETLRARPAAVPDAAEVGRRLQVLRAPAESLPQVGPKRAAELERFGLATVEDVLYHVPFRYEDRRRVAPIGSLRVGDEGSTQGRVASVRQGFSGRRGRRLLEVVLHDEQGALVLVWFNQVGYFARRFREGQRLLVHGRIDAPLGNGPARMVHPDVTELGAEEGAAERAGILPVYEKPTAMPVGVMRRLVHAAVERAGHHVPSGVPPEVAHRLGLCAPAEALRALHLPGPDADVDELGTGQSSAHRALAFDELFVLQLGLALRRSQASREAGRTHAASTRLVPALRAALPFRPTAAQDRTFAEIAGDLAAPYPMRRLLQGDVGSGKTLVALLAALTVAEAGAQVAFMAPTELLAEQHFETIRPLAAPLGVETALFTGAVKGAARRQVLAGLADGRIAVVVGTQALIQTGVDFARLGLAVVDEQHRFGVLQRAALQRQSGSAAALDVLVMSATPIPRTLALTLYGDLDVSTIDELPPGRTPIRTTLCRERRRQWVHEQVRAEVAAGHQAYVVYPLVEESEKSDLRAATSMARELADGPLAGLRLEVLHGRMKPDEKDRIMRRFKAHDFDVLVATTVVEVGIDVPNASVMVVEHAERFGLAQLHQLRGRVGRGATASQCHLVAPDWMAEDTFQRLRVLEQTTDGFAIAEADLALRGPGDFLGTRQAGLPPFRVASLVRDTALMRTARDEALRWLRADPLLERPESAVVRAVLAHRWAGRLELAQVG
jgi:ATP-dependent DNA helicase RecG